MPLEFTFDIKGQRGRRPERVGLPGSLRVPKKSEKKLSTVKKPVTLTAFTVKVLPFSRATDRDYVYIVALKRKSQSINSLPHYSRNEI